MHGKQSSVPAHRCPHQWLLPACYKIIWGHGDKALVFIKKKYADSSAMDRNYFYQLFTSICIKDNESATNCLRCFTYGKAQAKSAANVFTKAQLIDFALSGLYTTKNMTYDAALHLFHLERDNGRSFTLQDIEQHKASTASTFYNRAITNAHIKPPVNKLQIPFLQHHYCLTKGLFYISLFFSTPVEGWQFCWCFSVSWCFLNLQSFFINEYPLLVSLKNSAWRASNLFTHSSGLLLV